MTVVRKDDAFMEEVPGSPLSDSLTEMQEADKLDVIRTRYAMALRKTLSYQSLCDEMQTYQVTLPMVPDLVNLSECNKIYATAQEYLSRVSNIEMQAIANFDAWSRFRQAMAMVIAEKTSMRLVDKDILDLPNAATQQAAVRNKLASYHKLLDMARAREARAKAFLKIVEGKKADLGSVITNLTRQVKVLMLERSLTQGR